ncbi:hypothetical protein MTO96_009952 [Rhipicephalus appendiculatus]
MCGRAEPEAWTPTGGAGPAADRCSRIGLVSRGFNGALPWLRYDLRGFCATSGDHPCIALAGPRLLTLHVCFRKQGLW